MKKAKLLIMAIICFISLLNSFVAESHERDICNDCVQITLKDGKSPMEITVMKVFSVFKDGTEDYKYNLDMYIEFENTTDKNFKDISGYIQLRDADNESILTVPYSRHADVDITSLHNLHILTNIYFDNIEVDPKIFYQLGKFKTTFIVTCLNLSKVQPGIVARSKFKSIKSYKKCIE